MLSPPDEIHNMLQFARRPGSLTRRDEIAGVIGHELGHVRNHDTLTMTITAIIAGAVSMVAQFGMFFRGGNRDSNNGLGIVGSVLMLILAPLTSNERLIEIGNGCSDTRHDLFRHPNVKKK
jgi:hypothetical protein